MPIQVCHHGQDQAVCRECADEHAAAHLLTLADPLDAFKAWATKLHTSGYLAGCTHVECLIREVVETRATLSALRAVPRHYITRFTPESPIMGYLAMGYLAEDIDPLIGRKATP